MRGGATRHQPERGREEKGFVVAYPRGERGRLYSRDRPRRTGMRPTQPHKDSLTGPDPGGKFPRLCSPPLPHHSRIIHTAAWYAPPPHDPYSFLMKTHPNKSRKKEPWNMATLPPPPIENEPLTRSMFVLSRVFDFHPRLVGGWSCPFIRQWDADDALMMIITDHDQKGLKFFWVRARVA